MPRARAYDFEPLTADNWSIFADLFGPKGACAGCWCMWWRVPKKTFEEQRGNENRKALQSLVRHGHSPGVIAVHGDRAVGWCAIAPRSEYLRLANARVLKPLDDAPVWSITCLFVDKEHRRQGLSIALIEAAVRWAATQGATIIESYPLDPRGGSMADTFAFHGLPSAYEKAGFAVAAKPSDARLIMRRKVRTGGAVKRRSSIATKTLR
jgi:GNAT superfamily N-acetyltransferase